MQQYAPARYVATDYDAAQVRRTEAYLVEKFGGAVPPSVELRVADATKLEFEDRTFDAVFAFAALHHVERRIWHFREVP